MNGIYKKKYFHFSNHVYQLVLRGELSEKKFKKKFRHTQKTIHAYNLGFWPVGLLRIAKKCKGGLKGDAKVVKGDAKEVEKGDANLLSPSQNLPLHSTSLPPSHPPCILLRIPFASKKRCFTAMPKVG